MHVLRNTTSVALLLVTALFVIARADNPLAMGCNPAAQRTETEGGGVGYQPAPGARRAEAEGGGVGTVDTATRKTEAEGGGVGYQPAPAARTEAEGGGAGSAKHSAQMAASAPCK